MHHVINATCREAGYEAVEVNASDTRNKADASSTKGIGGKLANTMKELLDNSSLGGAGRKVTNTH